MMTLLLLPLAVKHAHLRIEMDLDLLLLPFPSTADISVHYPTGIPRGTPLAPLEMEAS